jgi:NADH:ubiquinone oxidoreductase subunit F (NADH-binding)/Pyruvate/2-oxoacid:ferredoxin oxidoreductase delta subunit/(2Fe-2S) ferredoxin
MEQTDFLTGPCCDRCWHSPAKQCPEYVECMHTGPLCHESAKCKEKKELAKVKIRHASNNEVLIYIGTGTCGLGAGAAKTKKAIEKYLGEKKLGARLIETGCIGICSAEPIVDIQLPDRPRLSFGTVTADRVNDLLDAVTKNKVPEELCLGQFKADTAAWESVPMLDDHPFFAQQTRWVLKNCGIIDPTSINDYLAYDGYRAFTRVIKEMVPEDVCNAVEESGLRGRGGGGFPAGKKWKFALNTPSSQKYFVCNADEGDPGAFMDRAVIESDPHRLIEGLAIAAYAIGASKAYVYLRAEYPLAIKRLTHAINEAGALGLLGYNILDSGFNLEIIIKKGAGAFVCGEETALINSIEGRRGMPRLRPPYPAIKGLFGHPTIINNVESLSNVPGIMFKGAETFRKLGTGNSTGTKVFALSGKVSRTGLVEIEMGKTIRDIVFDVGGGIPGGKKFKAVQIGGPSGGCIPLEHIDITIDYESLKKVGAMMGSGGLVVMDEDNCMVDVAKFFMEFIQRESCGKCIPCRDGTKRLLEILQSITRPRGEEQGNDSLQRFKGIINMEELAEVIKDTSLCGLGQTAPNPVLTTLRWFKDEYDAHIFDRRCPAGACVALLEYSIDESKCTGCTLCAKKCPTGAIKGARKSPHYVITEKCIGCGTCIDVCTFGAVTRS